MQQTRLGHGAVTVTRLSFGAAGIGNLFTPVTDEAAILAVEAAWADGIRSFDTAPHYGLGLSERRLGAALRGHARAEYTVATKVGRLLAPVSRVEGDDLANGFAVPAAHRRVWDFSADGVRRSLEASLDRLGLDRIDIAHLHDPDDHFAEAVGQAYPALEQLRAEGLVGAIGMGMNQSEMLTRFIRDTDIDAVLLAGRYTLLDQGAMAELLPEAARRGVSVIVGGVFNSGVLADPRPGATFDYATAPPELVDRALRMQAVCARHGVPLRAAAVRFALAPQSVTSVLIGARSADEVTDAVRLLDLDIPDALWQELQNTGLLPENLPLPQKGRPPCA
ncbi:aldo/keto reductase [Streptosporangium sp. NPDC000396]|uniref:aldo/keto reductase n=1 Tax=Streptosporangium sp. NPDC000396 TaxID=3366185 RepID=UPI00368B3FB0